MHKVLFRLVDVSNKKTAEVSLDERLSFKEAFFYGNKVNWVHLFFMQPPFTVQKIWYNIQMFCSL